LKISSRSTDQENKKVIHITFIKIKLFWENAYISMS